jgi:hypothetical protein
MASSVIERFAKLSLESDRKSYEDSHRIILATLYPKAGKTERVRSCKHEIQIIEMDLLISNRSSNFTSQSSEMEQPKNWDAFNFNSLLIPTLKQEMREYTLLRSELSSNNV